jgi:hypothetical protein
MDSSLAKHFIQKPEKNKNADEIDQISQLTSSSLILSDMPCFSLSSSS